jgi:CDP-diacylglycerol--glycerol-3-phosphate 3-phosphatidyltransferase
VIFLPNILTTLRLILIFPIIYLFYRSFFSFSFFLFLFSSLTDFFDGYFARKYNVVSDYGKCMDQISDKLIICSLLIMFVNLNIANVYVVIFIIFREILVSGLREFYALKNQFNIPVSNIGKIKTVLQMISVSMMFFYEFAFYANVILFLSLIFSIFSAILYLKIIIKNKD